MSEVLNKKKIQHLFSADVELQSWGFYPSVSGGVRVNTTVKGGEVFGPNNLTGEVIPGGEVNELLRYNGVFELEGRMTFKFADGTLVYLPYDGRADFCKPEECAKFADGTLTAPLNTYMAVYLESTDAKLDKMFAFAVGRLDDARNPSKLMVDVYEFECLPM
jgi:hypothetical protein